MSTKITKLSAFQKFFKKTHAFWEKHTLVAIPMSDWENTKAAYKSRSLSGTLPQKGYIEPFYKIEDVIEHRKAKLSKDPVIENGMEIFGDIFKVED